MTKGAILTYPYKSQPQIDPRTRQRMGRPFIALIDSGSDRNLFPSTLGEIMEMKIKSGKIRPIMGIGGKIIFAYMHEIKLYLGSECFVTRADFTYEQEVPLLGRDGFFNYFRRISLFEKEMKIELEV